MTELTVVIPIKNEAPALDQLYRELTETLSAWGRSYEVIFVDDGNGAIAFLENAKIKAARLHMGRYRLGGFHRGASGCEVGNAKRCNEDGERQKTKIHADSGEGLSCFKLKTRRNRFLSARCYNFCRTRPTDCRSVLQAFWGSWWMVTEPQDFIASGRITL